MKTKKSAPRKAKASIPKRREIESMTYGSPEQIAAADLWWKRFVDWRTDRNERQGDEGYYIIKAWRKMLFTDVWYLAQHRLLYANG